MVKFGRVLWARPPKYLLYTYMDPLGTIGSPNLTWRKGPAKTNMLGRVSFRVAFRDCKPNPNPYIHTYIP